MLNVFRQVFYNGFGFVFVYAAMLSWALDVFDLPLSRAVVVFGVIVSKPCLNLCGIRPCAQRCV